MTAGRAIIVYAWVNDERRLRQRGGKSDPYEVFRRMIAAHAISSDSILVTNNKADFRDIPGLSMENWVV